MPEKPNCGKAMGLLCRKAISDLVNGILLVLCSGTGRLGPTADFSDMHLIADRNKAGEK